MRHTLILVALVTACVGGDDGFSPPPPSPGTSDIEPGEGGPMGVLDAGEVTGGAGETTPDTGATTGGEATGATATGGIGRTCRSEFQTCEGDGLCMTDLRTGQFTCSHGGLGEPCFAGSLCQDGLVCTIDEISMQFVCLPNP